MKKSPLLSVLLCLLILATGCSKKKNTEEPVDKQENLLAAGKSANDILSNAKFTKLKIEIAYVTGFRPTEEALTEFVNYLRTYTFKEDIELVYKELDSPDEEDLTVQEIADLENDNRTAYNNGETLAIYIYFTDAPASEDEPEEDLVTLGAVYRNTSMVIHERTIRDLANQSRSISNADVEIATLNHEFGHLFGLVNLESTPVNDHEDTQSEHHCNVEGCLMRAELQFNRSGKHAISGKSVTASAIKVGCRLSGKSVLRMLESHTAKGRLNAVPLDAECILDLRSNGGR